MIAYSEVEAESLKLGVSPQIIEKDYHLDWYLVALGLRNLFPALVLYGGTAIKKFFIPQHRFSEDIDLISGVTLSTGAISEVLDEGHRFLESEANLFYSFRSEEIQNAGTQTRFVIHYRGFSELGGIKRFLLDFAQGIEDVPDPIFRKLITPYRDLERREIKIRVLPVEIICADKLALIVDHKRREPRDVYDLWSVLTHVKSFDRQLFMTHYRKALSYLTDFSIVRSCFRDIGFRNAWEMRLRHQVPDLPDFNVVTRELLENLEQLWSN